MILAIEVEVEMIKAMEVEMIQVMVVEIMIKTWQLHPKIKEENL